MDEKTCKTRVMGEGACSFLSAAAASEVVVHGFRDGYPPYVGGEVKDSQVDGDLGTPKRLRTDLPGAREGDDAAPDGGVHVPQVLALALAPMIRSAGMDRVWVVAPERFEDERGFFASSWDTGVFEEQRRNERLVQCSISHNRVRGTLRGLHHQAVPHEEAKLVRCAAGAVFDFGSAR